MSYLVTKGNISSSVFEIRVMISEFSHQTQIQKTPPNAEALQGTRPEKVTFCNTLIYLQFVVACRRREKRGFHWKTIFLLEIHSSHRNRWYIVSRSGTI